MAARVRFVTLLLVLGAGSAARPSSTQAVLSPKGVLDAQNNKPGLAELGAIAAGVIKGYDTLTFARHWLSRFVGGKAREAEIWAEYTQARDRILSTHRSYSIDLIADLRREFKRRHPAWVYLWA